MVAEDLERDPPPLVGEAHPAIADVGDVAERGELLHHRRDGRRADAQPFRQAVRGGDAVPLLEHVDRLRVVLDRRRKHRGKFNCA
jgi:hypothetical protein